MNPMFTIWCLLIIIVFFFLQSPAETVVSSLHQATSSAYPRHSPDSGVAMSTDSSSFSPQSLINSANTVLDKVPTDATNQDGTCSSGNVLRDYFPLKSAITVHHFPHPPPRLPLNTIADVRPNSVSTVLDKVPTGYNASSYGASSGLSSTAVVYSSAYSGYSTAPSVGPHYHPQSGFPASGPNCYANPPQRNGPNSYFPTQSGFSSLPFAEIPYSSSMDFTNSMELLGCVRNSPTIPKPLSSSQSLPGDEPHMSLDSSSFRSMDGFPGISLSEVTSSTDSKTYYRESCSDMQGLIGRR